MFKNVLWMSLYKINSFPFAERWFTKRYNFRHIKWQHNRVAETLHNAFHSLSRTYALLDLDFVFCATN